jgi:hypothetical protein
LGPSELFQSLVYSPVLPVLGCVAALDEWTLGSWVV